MSPENEKSRPSHTRDREPERLRIAVLREPVDRGAARVAEPEEPRALVERLARRVVERRPEPLRPAALAHGEQERVTAAGEQAEERRLDGIRPEVERRDVPLEVVDRDERCAVRPRDRLRGREADEQRARRVPGPA